MKAAILAAGLTLVLPLAAEAQLVTYSFKGLIERRPDGPAPAGNNGKLTPITVTLNSSAPGVVSGNTITYGGRYFAPSDPADPIISFSIGFKTYKGGGMDTVTIQKNPNGPSFISIDNSTPQIGGFDVFFTSQSYGGGVASLSIPAKIDTVKFDRSTFSINLLGTYAQGDMVTR